MQKDNFTMKDATGGQNLIKAGLIFELEIVVSGWTGFFPAQKYGVTLASL